MVSRLAAGTLKRDQGPARGSHRAVQPWSIVTGAPVNDPLAVTAAEPLATARVHRWPIPERDDQKAIRIRRGSSGGRRRVFDAEAYKVRNVLERCIIKLKKLARERHPL